MQLKIHIPYCQYGFIEAEGDDIEELIQLNNKYNENGKTIESNEDAIVTVKSFTEDVEINKIGYSYYYDGQKLLSPSSWIKQYYKPFEAEFIAKKAAKSYGIEPKDLLDMWNDTGKTAADFGTAIHQVLEFRENYRNIGSQIVEAKTKKNDKTEHPDPSIPKHPMLQKIILDFEKVVKTKGKVLTEVFVTDVKNGRCGIIDRLVITGDKRCVIQDIKINVNPEEISRNDKPLELYDGLDANKLSKYQLQTSYYDEILTQKGWEVQGREALVLDKKWKKYKFDKLEIKS